MFFWPLRPRLLFAFTLPPELRGTLAQGEELSEEARANTSVWDAFGKVKRDHRKENRVKVDRIGSLELSICEGQAFPEGARFRATFAKGKLRDEVTWENRERYLGRVFTVEYQSNGQTDLPRFGRITRMRNDK